MNIIGQVTPTDLEWWRLYAQIAAAIATIVAATIAATVAIWIGRRQVGIAKAVADTAAEKLKLDLFDRRYAVYLAASELLISMAKERPKFQEHFEQNRAISLQAPFLVGRDASEKLREVIKVAEEWRRMIVQFGENDFQFNDAMMKRRNEIVAWAAEMFTELPGVFYPYLDLQHVAHGRERRE